MRDNTPRHPREGGGPTPNLDGRSWIPVYVGMTKMGVFTLLLAACSPAPRTVTERDMPGVFSADATPGHRALMVQFLNDGRFGGDARDAGGIISTQGYWRIGAVDTKRGCTIIETKPRQGEWREGYCASIENERTALNCNGDRGARTCLMTRRPGKWVSAPLR